MRTLALTGGIATGKSTVAGMLRHLGAEVIDADLAARDVVRPGRLALAQIVDTFGSEVLAADGTLNRKALATVVFADPQKRRALEAITHPAIREQMAAQAKTAALTSPPLIVMDIPLFFETQSSALESLLVYTPVEVQLRRLVERDGLAQRDAQTRIDAQLPIERKRALATWVIDNSGTLLETQRQVDDWWAAEVSHVS